MMFFRGISIQEASVPRKGAPRKSWAAYILSKTWSHLTWTFSSPVWCCSYVCPVFHGRSLSRSPCFISWAQLLKGSLLQMSEPVGPAGEMLLSTGGSRAVGGRMLKSHLEREGGLQPTTKRADGGKAGEAISKERSFSSSTSLFFFFNLHIKINHGNMSYVKTYSDFHPWMKMEIWV